jgi:glycerol kinase
VVQTQADLLGREVEVGEVAEVSALGAAKLAWRMLGREAAWPVASSGRVYRPALDPTEGREHRQRWAREIGRTRFAPGVEAA